MSLLGRELRYERRLRRQLAAVEARLDVRVDVRIEARLTVGTLIPPRPTPPPQPTPADELKLVLAERDAWLASKGIRVIRVGKKEVLDISGVMDSIGKDIIVTMLARIATILFWFRVQQRIGR